MYVFTEKQTKFELKSNNFKCLNNLIEIQILMAQLMR